MSESRCGRSVVSTLPLTEPATGTCSPSSARSASPAIADDDQRSPASSSRRISRTRASTQRPRPLDDQLEHAVEVGLPAERRADRRSSPRARAQRARAHRGGGARRARRAARSRSPWPPSRRASRIASSSASVNVAALLLGEVEVAVGLAADADRHAEERRHRRMARREAVGPRMRADVVRAAAARGSSMSTPSTPRPRGRSPIARRGLVVDAVRDEPLEPGAGLVEDAERRVRAPVSSRATCTTWSRTASRSSSATRARPTSSSLRRRCSSTPEEAMTRPG